jgi:folate-dependent phosphoribosylglycinamide formyltransferase PurN
MPDIKALVLGSRAPANYALCHCVAVLAPDCRFLFEQPEAMPVFLKRRVKKLGMLQVAGQMFFQALAVPVLQKTSADRIAAIQRLYDLNTTPVDPSRVTEVPSINSPQAIQAVESIQPTVIVLAGTRILGKALLQAIHCPVINIHAGITPLYRGVHGGYWALVEKRPDLCGVTVHRVDAGIDTGEVLAQACFHPSAEDNFVTYPWIQLGEGLKLLTELLPRIVAGEKLGCKPMVSESQLRTHPTLWGYLRNRVFGGIK